MTTTRTIAALATLRHGSIIKRVWIVPYTSASMHQSDKWCMSKEYHEWNAESEATYMTLGGIDQKIIERIHYMTLVDVEIRSVIHCTLFIGQDARVR